MSLRNMKNEGAVSWFYPLMLGVLIGTVVAAAALILDSAMTAAHARTCEAYGDYVPASMVASCTEEGV